MPYPEYKEKETERAALRKKMKDLRQKQDAYQTKSYIAQELFSKHELFVEAHSLTLYMPIQGEIDTNLLLSKAWQTDKIVYLPRVLPNRQMEFAPIHSLDDLELGPFGIKEPRKNIPAVENFAPDLMLVPGVAFDFKGNRLGFGGGYYDRFFAAHKITCPLVGFCFAFQVVAEIPTMPWDFKMNFIFTENSCHKV